MNYLKQPKAFAAELLALYNGSQPEAVAAFCKAAREKAFVGMGPEFVKDVLLEMIVPDLQSSQGESVHA